MLGTSYESYRGQFDFCFKDLPLERTDLGRMKQSWDGHKKNDENGAKFILVKFLI